MKIAIVIPAYNEEKSIHGVIGSARKYGAVIVVNDASKDKTEYMAKKSGAIVITHKVNRGLGGSLRTGFKEAIRRNFDVVITLDADGQHNPDEIPKFIEKIEEGYDFVLGERDLSKYPVAKRFGNFWLNMLTNIISGTNLKDTESGFRAFTNKALRKLDLNGERYEIAADIIFEVGRNKLRTVNIPVGSPLYRKGVGVIDGIRNFNYVLSKKMKS